MVIEFFETKVWLPDKPLGQTLETLEIQTKVEWWLLGSWFSVNEKENPSGDRSLRWWLISMKLATSSASTDNFSDKSQMCHLCVFFTLCIIWPAWISLHWQCSEKITNVAFWNHTSNIAWKNPLKKRKILAWATKKSSTTTSRYKYGFQFKIVFFPQKNNIVPFSISRQI